MAPTRDNRRGILSMIVAMSAFNLSDALTKLSTTTLPLGETIAVRGFFAALLVAVWVTAAGDWGRIGRLADARVGWRLVGELGATLFYLAALVHVALPNVSAVFQATPLAFGDTLLFPTPYNRVVALDGRTGRELWSFDPQPWRTLGQPSNGTGFVHRGVVTWSDGQSRRAERFVLVAYDIPRGCLASYYPETNPLVPLESFSITARTPTSKSIPVVLTRHAERGLSSVLRTE